MLCGAASGLALAPGVGAALVLEQPATASKTMPNRKPLREMGRATKEDSLANETIVMVSVRK
jgi:hypothetical protein